MTDAQAKALELIEKFKLTLDIRYDMRSGVNPYARNCALNVVREILSEVPPTIMSIAQQDGTDYLLTVENKRYLFWQEVHQVLVDLR